MSQPRHDMYTAVHKGLRARLFDTASQLEGCNFADPTARTAILAEVTTTLAFLEEHAKHEDDFVQPRVADANPQLAERIAATHLLVEQSGSTVAKLVAALAEASDDLAVGRGPELCGAFNLLVSQHVAHMGEEEALANAALWQTFSDEELRELQGRLQASIPPPRFAEWMGIMLPALNVQERVGMLSGMKAGAPPEVFQAVMALGREFVGEPWSAVEAAVS